MDNMFILRDIFSVQDRQLAPQLPSKEESIFRLAMMFGERAGTPEHILLTGVVKEIKRQTGTDMSFALEGAKALKNVKKKEINLFNKLASI